MWARLATQILRVLALGLGLEESFFNDFTKDPIAVLRMIHYPPTPTMDDKQRGS